MWFGSLPYPEFLVRIAIKFARRIATGDWTAINAIVVSSTLKTTFTGCILVIIHYKYRNADERFEGSYRQPFIFRNYAEAYLRRYPGGSELPIIVSPRHPSSSIPIEGKIEFIKVR